jgi:hypothetical protein
MTLDEIRKIERKRGKTKRKERKKLHTQKENKEK